MKFGRPLSKPYTAIGITRVRCARAGCTNRATVQWQCCALKNRWFALCNDCDIGLNEIATKFLLGAGAKKVMAWYRKSRS